VKFSAQMALQSNIYEIYEPVEDMAQIIEHLLRKHKALNSNLTFTKKIRYVVPILHRRGNMFPTSM
jgi:hypothetical protein